VYYKLVCKTALAALYFMHVRQTISNKLNEKVTSLLLYNYSLETNSSFNVKFECGYNMHIKLLVLITVKNSLNLLKYSP